MAFNFIGKDTSTQAPPKQQNTSSKVNVKGMVYVDNLPVLKQQKDGNMSARVQFITTSDKLTPVMSVQLGQVNMLVRAFNKECPLYIPPKEDDAEQVESFLAYAANMINEGGEENIAYIREGFVNFISGMKVYLAEGNYFTFKVLGVSSRNDKGEPSWVENFFESKEVRVRIELLYGLNGLPTVWKGANVIVPLTYAFKEIQVDGKPGLDWVRKPDGGYSAGSHRFDSFVNVFSPGFHKALYDNTLEPKDMGNLIPEVVANLDKEVMATAFLKVDFSKKNNQPFYKLEWEKLSVVPKEMVDMFEKLPIEKVPETVYDPPIEIKKKEVKEEVKEPTKVEEPKIANDEEIDLFARDWLHQVMNKLAGEEAYNKDSLTEAGVVAAKKHLTPLKESGKIPAGELSKANFDYANTILTALVNGDTLDEEEREFVAAASQEVQEALIFDKSESNDW